MKNTKEYIVLTLCLSLLFSPSLAFAGPQGGKVVGGNANIHQSGTTTTINQSSDRAVINWNSFDIGKNEAVRHNMPSANSAGLHRVVGGGGPSHIEGLLQSNGNIYLVNPAGVVLHRGARVETNGFTATTRDIANDNFMKGNMVFDKPGHANAQIINQGSITVKDSGLAALVAPTVRNEGLIAGKLGKVAVASGDTTWKLDMHGDDLISFTVGEKDVNTLHAADGTPLKGVSNTGTIKAEGGVVVLSAAQFDGIVGSVVNSGEVSAASAEVKGGVITFKGEGTGVTVANTGTVDASSLRADGGRVRITGDGAVASSGNIAATGGNKGGKVTLTGQDVALTGSARIDVSGSTGGGTALVGGNALGKGPERNARTAKVESGVAIHADARTVGNGGQVVVWSDEKTTFGGTITARGGNEGGNGGQVETSGKNLKVGDSARVDTSAKKGVHGQWLLDPVDFVIAASGGDMTGTQLASSLQTNDITIKSTSGSNGTSGDINVNDTVTWSADTKLTLIAHRYVNVNANITATGNNAELYILPLDGDLYLNRAKITLSGNNQILSIDGDLYLNRAKIILSGNNPILSIYDKDYAIINNIQELQDINNDLAGIYALGTDIDATITANWNDGKGFKPIGYDKDYPMDSTRDFNGILNGLGNIIKNLTINRHDEYCVGLFGAVNSGAKICNIGIENANIKGAYNVGVLAGVNGALRTLESSYTYAMIQNCYTTGTVEGYGNLGGFVGTNSGEIFNSSSSATVIARGDGGSAARTIGGFVGSNSKDIYSSFSTGNIYTHKDEWVGGFIGLLYGRYDPVKIENCYSTGRIIRDDAPIGIGSFIGEAILNSNGFIKNSYSHTTMIDKANNTIGINFIGDITATYDTTFAVTSSYFNENYSKDKTGYYFVVVPGKYNDNVKIADIDVKGIASEDMVKQQSYNGWDFDNIWNINEGKSSPYLRNVAVNISNTLPTPTPAPEPWVDPTPAPTPDTENKANPIYSSFHDIDKNKNISDKVLSDVNTNNKTNMPSKEIDRMIVNNMLPGLSDYTDSMTAHIQSFYDILPSLYNNAVLRHTLINASSSIILAVTKFIAGDRGELINIIFDTGKSIMDLETFDLLTRMSWSSSCMKKSKYHIEQAENQLKNCNTREDIKNIVENLKSAREYELQSIILSGKEIAFANSMHDKGALQTVIMNTWEVTKGFGEQALGDIVKHVVSPSVKDVMTNEFGELVGITSKAFVEHGKSAAEFEQFITTEFKTPARMKSLIKDHPSIKSIDSLLSII